MRILACCLLLAGSAWAQAAATAQPPSMRIGAIDFFGTAGVDVAAVRAALPVKTGDTIAESDFDSLKQQIDAAVSRTAGGLPSDVSGTCCDAGGGLMIYIGLPGKNSRSLAHLAQPTGSACLPGNALELYSTTMDALAEALRAGDAAEDHNQGYALSHNPALHARQLAMREYAVKHAAQLETALRECRNAENRQAAAHLLGYAKRSPEQISALVRAGNDSDGTVRNNAVRALWVIASSGKRAARAIPAQPFIAMLNSGTWEDRNKAGLLLTALTESRDPKLLSQLRQQAFDSLAEMARWHNLGHAGPYRELLGKIAGFDDHRIHQLIAAGKVDEFITAAEQGSSHKRLP